MTLLPSLIPDGADPDMFKLHQRLQKELQFYSRNALYIKPKVGPLEPFVFNSAQEYLHAKIEEQKKRIGKVRVLIVKGRQQGCSTYVAARYYHKVTTTEGQSVFILSHESGTTGKLFSMVSRFHEHSPEPLKPEIDTDNRKEMKFKLLNSDYTVGTAGNESVGRGGTIQLFHGSEVAYWANTDEIQTGILQSIPDLPDTEIILESTANGMANMFYDLVCEAEAKQNDYQVIFIPWYWQTEYRRDTPANGEWDLSEEEAEYQRLYSKDPYKKIPLDKEQIYWMRAKISEFKSKWKFFQEYPAYLQQAFQTSGQSLILPEAVIRARKSTITDPNAALIIGVDPGRTKDRSVFVYRRGRHIFKYEVFKFNKADKDNVQMVLAGLLANRIDLHSPDAVYVDVGEGNGIIDRLRELGYQDTVHGIHSGEEPLDPVFLNKRAEMWCLMRDWFHGEDGPVRCPDEDVFQRDICAMPESKLTSSQKTQLVSSEVIRAKVKMSLDIGTAAAHTFAYPVRRKNLPDQKNKFSAPGSGKSKLITLRNVRRQGRLNSR